MLTDELDYALPPERIATAPADPRDSARLMVVRRDTGDVAHHHIRDLPQLGILRTGDLLVFNQSKVIPAYFQLTRTATGGRVTGLYLSSEPAHGQWHVLLEAKGKLQPGELLHFHPVCQADPLAHLQLIQRQPDARGQWLAQLHSSLEGLALLEHIGSPPLPPYIRRQRQAMNLPALTPADRERYNTIYAAESGSVAAPTAGLHFTSELLARLDALGVRRAMVTLHVGLGTFAPIQSQHVEDHPIHSETCHVPLTTLQAIAATRSQGGRVIPIGTTTVRTLESLPMVLPALRTESLQNALTSQTADLTFDTNLLITPAPDGSPGFDFRFTDLLLTNFHLPRSSLLALVASLPGMDVPRLKSWYAQAIAHHYRFYSYGDAMLLA